MIIIVSENHYKELEDNNFQRVTIDGEQYENYHDLDDELQEDGYWRTIIFRRNSDNKYFELNVFYTRYGYDDYSVDLTMQSDMMHEVEFKEIRTYKWVKVEE